MSDKSNVMDNRGHYYRTPTPGEYAQSTGVEFNEEVDTSKLGKVGTKSELDDDDDDDGFGGDGGFLWSF